MQTATLNELQKQLKSISNPQLVQVCIRLAKYKKENKELLNYLLFEATDEESFIRGVKTETELAFSQINTSNMYYAKKGIRKALRIINRYIKFSGIARTDAELRMHFCRLLLQSGISFKKSPQLMNLYNKQVEKIKTSIGKLHEDLQYDYMKELREIAPVA
jgi:hypothetical protein